MSCFSSRARYAQDAKPRSNSFGFCAFATLRDTFLIVALPRSVVNPLRCL